MLLPANMEKGQYAPGAQQNIGRVYQCKPLAGGLAAYRQSRHNAADDNIEQRGRRCRRQHHDAQHDGRTGCARNNTAHIPDNVVTKTGHLVGMLQQKDALLRAVYFFGSHGQKGLRSSGRSGDADNIKHDAQRDQRDQNQNSYQKRYAAQQHLGNKADSAGYDQRDQRYLNRPVIFLFPSPFGFASAAFPF